MPLGNQVKEQDFSLRARTQLHGAFLADEQSIPCLQALTIDGQSPTRDMQIGLPICGERKIYCFVAIKETGIERGILLDMHGGGMPRIA